jgi:regulator of cell morphogenesis and NO signaling
MTTTTHNLTTVAELVITMPSALGVLDRLGIDYCCNGQQSVMKACATRGITTDELLSMIEAEPKPAATRDWAASEMANIVRFIVDTHHRYTRGAIAMLPPLADKVYGVHGERHPELARVAELTKTAAADLLPHMLKEEQILFPYITALETAVKEGTEPPMPFFGTVKNPVHMMMLEHETVGEILAELRSLTNDYALPEEACTSYRLLFERLAELESDLHRHIHLENNILFPRALETEAKVETTTTFAVPAGGCGGNCHH